MNTTTYYLLVTWDNILQLTCPPIAECNDCPSNSISNSPRLCVCLMYQSCCHTSCHAAIPPAMLPYLLPCCHNSCHAAIPLAMLPYLLPCWDAMLPCWDTIPCHAMPCCDTAHFYKAPLGASHILPEGSGFS